VTAQILVAEEDPFNLRLLQELCEAAGYTVITAAKGSAVLDAVARDRPSLILMSLTLPDLDGFEVMRVLKADAELASIPVVVVTGAADADLRARAIELGAEDYVTKPYRVFEVQQRVRNALRLQAAESAAAVAHEIVRDNELVDPLTRAGTSHQLQITVNYEFTRAARYKHDLTCLSVRLANYEQIAASGGPDAGEGALVQLATGLRSYIRTIDHVFRSEIDAFVVVLPETDEDGALAVLKRLQAAAQEGTLWGALITPLPKLRCGLASYPKLAVPGGEALLHAAVENERSNT